MNIQVGDLVTLSEISACECGQCEFLRKTPGTVTRIGKKYCRVYLKNGSYLLFPAEDLVTIFIGENE